MLGISIIDRIRNEDIRKRVRTTPVLNFIKKQQGQMVEACDQTTTKWPCYTTIADTKLELDHKNDGPTK
jgi:hypothetical protein